MYVCVIIISVLQEGFYTHVAPSQPCIYTKCLYGRCGGVIAFLCHTGKEFYTRARACVCVCESRKFQRS